MPKNLPLEFQDTPTISEVKIAKTFKTSKGDTLQVIAHGSTLVVTQAKKTAQAKKLGMTLVISKTGNGIAGTGPDDIATVNFISQLWEGVQNVIGKAVDLIVKGCNMETSTHVSVVDGKVTGITTTTKCVPN